jgi:hypothetical protein
VISIGATLIAPDKFDTLLGCRPRSLKSYRVRSTRLRSYALLQQRRDATPRDEGLDYPLQRGRSGASRYASWLPRWVSTGRSGACTYGCSGRTSALRVDERPRKVFKIDTRAGNEALSHAFRLEQRLLHRWPKAWARLDKMCRRRRIEWPDKAGQKRRVEWWPDWCLLPMAGPASIPDVDPPLVPAMSALYAWRYTRSVFQVEPDLMDWLLTQGPDVLDVGAAAGLPVWCVYVATSLPEFPEINVWMHLDWDGQPELRLLLDMGEDDLPRIAIAVYLNRGDSATEALAAARANALVIAERANTSRGYRRVAAFADAIGRYVSLAMYLARPDADVVSVGGSVNRVGVWPRKRSSYPKEGSQMWDVGARFS